MNSVLIRPLIVGLSVVMCADTIGKHYARAIAVRSITDVHRAALETQTLTKEQVDVILSTKVEFRL